MPVTLSTTCAMRCLTLFLACTGCASSHPPSTGLPKTDLAANERMHDAEGVADTIRAYDPKTGSFFRRKGRLFCESPSVSEWAARATEYMREVRSSIEVLRKDFSDCYISQLRENATTAGTSCIRLVVGSGGQVSVVEMAAETLPEKLQECVLLSASRANVPPLPNAPSLTVMLPLTFVSKEQ